MHQAEWRTVTPAPPSAILALAGRVASMRRRALAQRHDAQTVAIYRGDAEMAVAFLGRHGWRRLEMALAIGPAAAPHLRRLVRLAQMTLGAASQTHLIVARVHPANQAGARMAAMVGFQPSRLKQAGIWIFKGDRHGCDARRRRQRGAQGGGTEPADTGDRQ